MKKYLIVIFIVLIFFSTCFGFFVALASKMALFDVFLGLSPKTPFFPEANILVLGIDNAFGHRSDTIMVLHTDPEKKEADLISIPRDTLAVIPGRGLDKINHAYAYGGLELARKSVESLLNIEIPYYIIVDLSGITNLIDELGGINIDVEKRMYYIDYAGELNIDLYPGPQKLSGRQAMGYLRYRSDGGDFSRISRQQKFIFSLANEMVKRQNLFRSPRLFMNLLSYLETNLNSRETLGLCLGLRGVQESNRISMATLPGTDLLVDGIYYWRPDIENIKNLVSKFTNKTRISSLN